MAIDWEYEASAWELVPSSGPISPSNYAQASLAALILTSTFDFIFSFNASNRRPFPMIWGLIYTTESDFEITIDGFTSGSSAG